MKKQNKYYLKWKLADPAYNVIRIAGRHIRHRAAEYFAGRMLEIGCGKKAKSLLVGEFVDKYIGLDLQSCIHGRSNIDVFATAYKIPFKNASFDCILSTAVLEHLEEPEAALTEAYRVLVAGGYVLYTVPLFWHIHEEPRDFYRYTKYGIRYLFEKAGFQIVEIKTLSGFWITFGSELNYYIKQTGQGPLKVLAKLFIAINNIVFPLLDKIDRRFNNSHEKWTWMYSVVARKPQK